MNESAYDCSAFRMPVAELWFIAIGIEFFPQILEFTLRNSLGEVIGWRSRLSLIFQR
jgi:hypothetical protein